jgi:hypothetical protein
VDRLHRRAHVRRIALDRAERHRLHAAPGERAFDAFEAGLAVGIVLVEDGEPLDAGARQLIDDLLGLVVVARADVEDVAIERRAQRLGAGEGATNGTRASVKIGSDAWLVGVPT